jgi:c-di-GMP-binding flagellar brake protein YcgR
MPTGTRINEDWRSLIQQGQRVLVAWDGGPRRGTLQMHGEVRMTFEETVWIWLDEKVSAERRPTLGQAIQVMTARADAMRMIPCRLVEQTKGASFQVAISGRVARVQRRDDVRMRVDLPPVSAVRLSPSGQPVGLLGLNVIDLSAGGIRVQSSEPIRAGENLRLVLRLDDGEPITTAVEILIGGYAPQGRFGTISERDRRRVVQYVYREELAERNRIQAERLAD